MTKIKLEGEINWIPVKSSDYEVYEFPNELSTYMKKKYNHPAIYRWSIRSDEKIEEIYIGETELLCPRRLYHYIKPGPSQKTNIRLNNKFKGMIEDGSKVTLEILDLSMITLDGNNIPFMILENKYLRRGLEGIILYRLIKDGIKVINA